MSLQIIKTFTLLFAIALLFGCGQKGDLYQPGKKPATLVSFVHMV